MRLTQACGYRNVRFMHMEPAKSIIAKLGGPEVVAAITGKHVSRIYRWMYPRSRGGTDGVIPHADAKKLLEHAQSADVDLDPKEFFEDAPEASCEATSSEAADVQ